MSDNNAEQHWDALHLDDKKSALQHANLGYGVVLDANDDWSVKLGKYLIKLDYDSFKFPPEFPDNDGYDAKACETLAEFHLRNFGLKEVKANAGLSGTIEGITGGVSGSTSSKHTQETTHDTKKTTYYMYAEYLVEKVKLDLKDKWPEITPDFEKALRDVAKVEEESVQKLTSFYKVMNEFGWYLPTSLSLGGKLIQTQTVETDKDTKTSKIEDDFSEDFKASVGMPGLFKAEGGGSKHTNNQHDTSSTHYQAVSTTHRHPVGGNTDGLEEGALHGWLKSLNDAQTWKVVGLELMPSLAFMPGDLLNDIRTSYNAYGSRETAERIADVDVFQYMTEVDLKSPDGMTSEFEDWS